MRWLHSVRLSCVAAEILFHLLFIISNQFNVSRFRNSQVWMIAVIDPHCPFLHPSTHLPFLLGCGGGCESAPGGSWLQGSDVQFSAAAVIFLR